MVDAPTNKPTSPTASSGPRSAAMAAEQAAAPVQPTSQTDARGSRRADTASFDEMLAKEVLASLKRTQAMARAAPVKPAPRKLVPPATLVVRPPKSYPWMAPLVSLASYVGFSSLLCAGGLAYLFLQPPPIAKPPVAELRTIRDSVEQLRRNVAELSNDVATNRSALAAASQAVNDRIVRLAAHVDRAAQATPVRKVERLADDGTQLARAEPTDPSAEITGTIQPQQRPPSAQPEIIAGWRVRRAYDDVALLEGPSGVIEVSLGQDIPALGRIQDIKTVGGRAQVSTSRGVINSAR